MVIYLDHCATTPMRPEVAEAMRHWHGPAGNPASVHSAGRAARKALEESRELIADRLGALAEEVIFTSGATEANNLAIFGLAGEPPGHIITSPIEHPCVLEPIEQLRKRGFEVEHCPLSADGAIDFEFVRPMIRPDTRLISLQLVNHETGAILRDGIRQHSGDLDDRNSGEFRSQRLLDAAQAVGKVPVHFHQLGATALTVSGHKIGGPVGVGALLLRKHTKLSPMLFGGHQQLGKRPGTESTALAVGLAAAVDLVVRNVNEESARMVRLRKRLLEQLPTPFTINGPADGVPHVVNVSFPGCSSDLMVINMDLRGMAISAGSACASGSMLPSPVLTAMGLSEPRVKSAVRISFGWTTTDEEIDEAAKAVRASVGGYRPAQ